MPPPFTPSLHGSIVLFIVGYLATWSGFAVLATGAQWALHDAALVSPMGVSTSRWLGGALLLVAGVYQFTAAKDVCLRQCRTPLGFLLNHWQGGGRGALVMGLRHGAICVGCCWALMAVLFVLGVMNLWWIALVPRSCWSRNSFPARRSPGSLVAPWWSGAPHS